MQSNHCEVHAQVGGSLIHSAAARGDVDMIKSHLGSGEDINAYCEKITGVSHIGRLQLHFTARECTPLIIGVAARNIEVVQYLLEHGANPNLKTKQGESSKSALTIAILKSTANKDFIPLIKVLLDAGADPNSKYNDPDLDVKDISALQVALEAGMEQESFLLLDKGASATDVSTDIQGIFGKRLVYPLHCSIECASPAIVDRLLSLGADVNFKASQNDFFTQVTALHTAAGRASSIKKDLRPVLKTLLDHGADINAVCENGDTALHYAFKNDSNNEAQFLIEHGADQTIKNKQGKVASQCKNK
ncbi:hypothetical protein AKO1_004796 [Acrasis kona]|uniref:Ankyrin repeat protein n=1 Tax=Acrasis kona TaxID=1008807 RepID=A0AAW2YHF5_9EUKA